MASFDPRLDPKHKDQLEYVERAKFLDRHFYEQVQANFAKTNDWWDLFLAIQEDTRDPVDEAWRSDVFVPLPFVTTRTKAAQGTELLGNVEPIWQVEAAREGPWYEQSKQIERLLEYTHRQNAWRKFLYKLLTARSVQGTAFFKVVWTRRSHVYNFYPDSDEIATFEEKVAAAAQMWGGPLGAPDWRTQPDEFETWRKNVNLVGKFGQVPAPPVSGLRDSVEYEGPMFQYLPLWTIRLDPMIDEIKDQKFIIHRMIKPLSVIESMADDDPNSRKPYLLRNVKEAMGHWNGEDLEREQQVLAESLGLNPAPRDHPYLRDAVQIQEIWSSGEKFKYAVIMNERAVINKRPFEHPLLTTTPNIFALRNATVPGHFYGLSDYQEPEKLFRELNQFRRIRMDGATLTTLPVFVKQQGVALAEAMRKLKPGMILTLPTKDAIQSLIKHTLPPEAYREPQEIKMEIDDAVEVPPSLKGAQAAVGRVTGTEFQGRQGQALLKYKVDASLIEEELLALPQVILGLYAQLGTSKLRMNIGGDPDALVDVTRDQLIQAIGYNFRMRGATKNIDPSLQVQQLNMILKEYADVLVPSERRFALKLVMEMLDIRGWSGVLTAQGEQQITMAAQMGMGAQNAQNQQVQQQADMAANPAPAAVSAGGPEAAQAGVGGGGAPQ